MRIRGSLWTFVGSSANVKPLLILSAPSVPFTLLLFPSALVFATLQGALHPLCSCFDLKPKGSLPTDFTGPQASSQLAFCFLL